MAALYEAKTQSRAASLEKLSGVEGACCLRCSRKSGLTSSMASHIEEDDGLSGWPQAFLGCDASV